MGLFGLENQEEEKSRKNYGFVGRGENTCQSVCVKLAANKSFSQTRQYNNTVVQSTSYTLVIHSSAIYHAAITYMYLARMISV